MIPDPWEFLLLALAAMRLTRLIGWDEFPLAVRVRDWLTGLEFRLPDGEPEPVGHAPSSPVGAVEPTHRRPVLAHLLACPWCLGWWVSLSLALLFWASPTAALIFAIPWALSAAVGLIVVTFDPA